MTNSQIEENSSTPSRLCPAIAIIQERFSLTAPNSTKHTFHIRLDISKTPIHFKVGDSIGIYAQNDPLLVSHLIEAMQARPEDPIVDPRSNTPTTLWAFLSFKANLARLTSSFLNLLYAYEHNHDKKNDLHRLLQQENRPLLTQYLSSHDPLDLFREYRNTKTPLQELCAQFSPLLPRFYSVASSQEVHPNHVDLTVALFTFSHQGEQRYGVASHFLCHLAEVGKTPIPIYVQSTPHFTLPIDDKTPIIMIGPGTGVAPYRAFLQERIHRKAPGKNWLFFGERNQQSDYLYGQEWETLRKTGHLRLDLAFSRDQTDKIYVQHKMEEHGKEIWAWLEEGAHFYVCGDAHQMAKDVEHTLRAIIQQHGSMSEECAKNYFKSLRTQKRYLTDVY